MIIEEQVAHVSLLHRNFFSKHEHFIESELDTGEYSLLILSIDVRINCLCEKATIVEDIVFNYLVDKT